MIVTVINRANPSSVVQFTNAEYSNNNVQGAITQDSQTYTFANSDYKFITVDANA